MPRASRDKRPHQKPGRQGPDSSSEPPGGPAPWTPAFQTSDLQDCDTINFWGFKPPSLPEKTETRSRKTMGHYCHHPGKDEGEPGQLGRSQIPGIF